MQYYSSRHFVASSRHPGLVHPVTGFVNMIQEMNFFPHMTHNYVSMTVNSMLFTYVYMSDIIVLAPLFTTTLNFVLLTGYFNMLSMGCSR